MSLTAEQKQKASEMWLAGATSGQISAALSIGRNALLGLARRDRQAFPARVTPETRLARDSRDKIERRVAAKAAIAQKEEPAEVHVPEVDEAPNTVAFRPLPGVKPVLVHVANGCRWPVHPTGDPLTEAARHFCGARRSSPNLSYCPVHLRMSAGHGMLSERNAVADARRVA